MRASEPFICPLTTVTECFLGKVPFLSRFLSKPTSISIRFSSPAAVLPVLPVAKPELLTFQTGQPQYLGECADEFHPGHENFSSEDMNTNASGLGEENPCRYIFASQDEANSMRWRASPVVYKWPWRKWEDSKGVARSRFMQLSPIWVFLRRR